MRPIDILHPITNAAFDRYAITPFNHLSETEQTVILIRSLQGEVSNGGFDQFYYNSSGDFAAETVVALERIGAKRIAAVVAESNRLFPTQPPPSERSVRIAELDGFTDEMTEAWDHLEREFYSDPDELDELLLAYLVHAGVPEAQP